MAEMWKKGFQAWQLPDSAQKADDKANASSSDLSKDSAAPSFEIDFSNPGTPTQEAAAVANVQPEVQAPVVEHEPVPSLEIGVPGQFTSAQHDHGIRLNQSETVTQSSTGGFALSMIDEPLPESLGGGAAGLQDQFVAEVLKGAAGLSGTSLSSQDEQPTMVVANPATTAKDNLNAALGDSDDKTIATYKPTTAATEETVASLAIDMSPPSPPASSLSSPQSTVIATPMTPPPPAAAKPPAAAPPSPAVPPPSAAPATPPPASVMAPPPPSVAQSPGQASEKTKVGATQAAGNSASSKTEKTNATTVTKVGAAKDKAGAGAKKAGTGQGQKAKEGTNVTNVRAASEASTAPATVPISAKGLSKEVRLVIGVFVAGLVMLSAALFKQMTKQKSTQQMATEISQSSIPKETTDLVDKPSKKTSSKEAPSLDKKAKLTPTIAQTSTKKMQAVQNKDPETSKDFNPERDDGTEGDDSDFAHILTRPTSRYGENNRLLAGAVDINTALDRVQPRRVQTMLRNLPSTFSTSDAVQKTALRELTARYYMQVGAFQKAIILFQQACSDPVKTSEVEVCLHAARSYIVMGYSDDAKTILNGLSTRLIGQNNQWRDWLKLLEIAVPLKTPTPDLLIRFTDELADKGPFLTSEWNIQLATFFARSFLKMSSGDQFEYLNQLMGARRKLIEVRLAPEKYGQDIGSYMFIAFVNLMLRQYELPQLMIFSEEPDTDSELSLTSWIFHVISQSKANEPRETRARLAPLFAERGFSALARLIEGQLAAQAGDYVGAHSMIVEQIGPTIAQDSMTKDGVQLQTRQFIMATQRLRSMPFLFVEWLFLGVKVSVGLNDKESLKTYLVALEDARRRFPELSNELQYWIMIGRANRVLGQIAGVEMALAQAQRLASTKHELGFVGADRVWLLMKKGQKKEAKQLMRQLIREIPHHARLLELAAEFSAPWGEEPSYYLKLEAEIPQRFQTRGRDSVLVSNFTLRKLLNNY